MKHALRTLLLGLMVAISCTAGLAAVEPSAKPELEVYAALASEGEQYYLTLRLTNRTATPRTVLTKQPSLLSMSANGRRAPIVDISHRILETSDPVTGSWRFIPSLPDLGPVTLMKDDTASILLPLDLELSKALREPNAELSIKYEIHKDIAERFGLWQGKLEHKESVASLQKR
jgi:hypothetical protein